MPVSKYVGPPASKLNPSLVRDLSILATESVSIMMLVNVYVSSSSSSSVGIRAQTLNRSISSWGKWPEPNWNGPKQLFITTIVRMEVYNKWCFKNINPCLQKSSSSGFVTVQDNELKPHQQTVHLVSGFQGFFVFSEFPETSKPVKQWKIKRNNPSHGTLYIFEVVLLVDSFLHSYATSVLDSFCELWTVTRIAANQCLVSFLENRPGFQGYRFRRFFLFLEGFLYFENIKNQMDGFLMQSQSWKEFREHENEWKKVYSESTYCLNIFLGVDIERYNTTWTGQGNLFWLWKVITSLFFVFVLNFLLSTAVPGERGLGSAVGGYERWQGCLRIASISRWWWGPQRTFGNVRELPV